MTRTDSTTSTAAAHSVRGDHPAGVPFTQEDLSHHIDYPRLEARIGKEKLSQRLLRQAEHVADVFEQKGTLGINFERIDHLIERAFKLTGLYAAGRANCLRIRVEENRTALPGLPPALEGLRILHLSDLHTDILPELADAIIAAIAPLDYDSCLITGDYRNSTSRDYGPAMALTCRVFSALKGPVLAILGNHDFIEMAPILESTGARVLLNEGELLYPDRGGLFIAGVDDPEIYGTHDLEAASRFRPEGVPAILLAHSPSLYREAAAAGFDWMLCGHTHAGQICLPGSFPLVRNARCPSRMLRGSWCYETLQGYTSRGTGSCGVPVRFFCPPEVTVHTLARA